MENRKEVSSYCLEEKSDGKLYKLEYEGELNCLNDYYYLFFYVSLILGTGGSRRVYQKSGSDLQTLINYGEW